MRKIVQTVYMLEIYRTCTAPHPSEPPRTIHTERINLPEFSRIETGRLFVQIHPYTRSELCQHHFTNIVEMSSECLNVGEMLSI